MRSSTPMTKSAAGSPQGLKPQVLWFSRQHAVERGAFVRGDTIVYRDARRSVEIMPVSEIALKGAHNVENVLAAVAIGMAAGVEPAAIRRAVKDFRAVEHRLEYVATLRGVQYYNDSKATNVDATIKALESFPGQHSPHPRRQGQGQRLQRAERR